MRKKCQVEGCNSVARYKGFQCGKKRYGRHCQRHHKKLSGGNGKLNHIQNSECEVCGWNRGPCDRHRIDASKGYYKENVKALCPNCHRLVTLGLVTLKEGVLANEEGDLAQADNIAAEELPKRPNS